MDYITQIVLDMSGKDRTCLAAVQGDKESRVINATLNNFVIPESTTARIVFRKPSGMIVFADAEVSDGSVVFCLSEQMLAEEGDATAEVKLYQGDSLLTSARMKIRVYPQVLDENKVESSQEFSALTNALQKVDGLQNEIEQAVQEANDAADRAEEAAGSAGGFLVGDGLIMEGGVLSVDTAKEVEEDNTKPVTSGAVYTQLGNVEALLASI